jgi:hypothetical protein
MWKLTEVFDVVYVFVVEGFRGITDTTRSTFPVVWFGRNKEMLNAINAKYTAAFEAGS